MKRVVSPFKVVEQWDLEIYTLILLWRYVRRGERKKKKKQNRNRETFVSEAADISKNLTYTQGGGTRHRKRSHTTSLVVPWTTLSRSKLDDSSGLKGYCETTLPPDSLIFPNLPRFFFFLSPFPFVRSSRDAVTVIFLRKQICLRDRLDRRRQSAV